MQLLQTYLGLPQSMLRSPQVVICRDGAVGKSRKTHSTAARYARSKSPPFDPTKLGMHAAGLLLRAGVFDAPGSAAARASCCAYIKVRAQSWCLCRLIAQREGQ